VRSSGRRNVHPGISRRRSYAVGRIDSAAIRSTCLQWAPLGLAFWTNQLWQVVTLLGTVGPPRLGCDAREERYLEARFPATNLPYKESVRRGFSGGNQARLHPLLERALPASGHFNRGTAAYLANLHARYQGPSNRQRRRCSVT